MFAAQEDFRKRQLIERRRQVLENSTVAAVVMKKAKSVRHLLASADEEGEEGVLTRRESDLGEFAVDARDEESQKKPQFECSGEGRGARGEKGIILKRSISYLKTTLRQYKRRYGTSDARTLAVLNNLGVGYYNKNLFLNAQQCFKLCYEERKDVLGPYHESTVDTMFNLATTYAHLSRCDDAISLYEQCLRTREKMFGDVHEQTLAVINNMAWAYTELREEQLATGLYDYLFRLRIAQMVQQVENDTREAAEQKQMVEDSVEQCVAKSLSGSLPPVIVSDQHQFPSAKKREFLSRTLSQDTTYSVPGEDDDEKMRTSQTPRQLSKYETCQVNVLRARFNLALCGLEFGHIAQAVEVLQACKNTCVQLFGINHRASIRVIDCLVDAQSRHAFAQKKCKIMSNYYSNETLVQKDSTALKEARARHKGGEREVRLGRPNRHDVGSGGVLRNPEKWIDEALYDTHGNGKGMQRKHQAQNFEDRMVIAMSPLLATTNKRGGDGEVEAVTGASNPFS